MTHTPQSVAALRVMVNRIRAHGYDEPRVCFRPSAREVRAKLTRLGWYGGGNK